MQRILHGRSLSIVYLEETLSSREAAARHVPANQSACIKQVDRVLERLAEQGVLRNETLFRHEGQGIYAAKGRCGLRAYGFHWHSPTWGPCFVVSHFVMKKRDRLDPSDLARTLTARDALRRRNG